MQHTLSFVPLNDAGTAHIAQVLSCEAMLRYMDLPPWEHSGEVAALLQSCSSGHSSLHILYRNGFPTGIAGLSHICYKHHFASVTCGILPAYQRSGLAREALGRIELLAFQRLSLHRIEAQVHENNLPCISLLAELGYREEGRMRGNFKVGDSFYDSVLMSKLSSESRDFSQ